MGHIQGATSSGQVGCESEAQAERLELVVWCHHPNWRLGAGMCGRWLSGMKHYLPVALRICRHKLVIPLGPPFPGSLRHVFPLSYTYAKVDIPNPMIVSLLRTNGTNMWHLVSLHIWHSWQKKFSPCRNIIFVS